MLTEQNLDGNAIWCLCRLSESSRALADSIFECALATAETEATQLPLTKRLKIRNYYEKLLESKSKDGQWKRL